MNIPLENQADQGQAFLQEQDNRYQEEQVDPVVPLVQVAEKTETTIGLLARVRWERVVFITILLVLFGWTVYYGIVGGEDIYALAVLASTGLIYFIISISFGSLAFVVFTKDNGVKGAIGFSGLASLAIVTGMICIYSIKLMVNMV